MSPLSKQSIYTFILFPIWVNFSQSLIDKRFLFLIHFLDILKAHRNILASLMIGRTLRSRLPKRRISISIFPFHSCHYFYSLRLFFKYTHIINFTDRYLRFHIPTSQPYACGFSLGGFHRYQKNTNEITIIISC